MYVVRIDLPDGRKSDWKGFAALPAAKKRLAGADRLILAGDVVGAFLFDVPGEIDVRRAVEAVQAGRATLLARDPWARIDKDIEAMVDDMLRRSPDAQGS
jgi:hypothetical protein